MEKGEHTIECNHKVFEENGHEPCKKARLSLEISYAKESNGSWTTEQIKGDRDTY